MIFSLNVKTLSGKIKFKTGSALVKFFIDSKNLKTGLNEFEKSFGIKINSVLKKNFLNEKSNEIKFFTTDGKPDTLLLSKIKLDNSFNNDFFRNYLAGIIISLEKENLSNLYVLIPSYNNFKNYFADEDYFYQSFIEGIHLGNYTFDYKSEKKKIKNLNIVLHSSKMKLVERSKTRAEKLMQAVYFSRDLINEPAITLTPAELAIRTKKELTKSGAKVTVWNEKELQRRKMNAVLAVGKASSNPPRMIIINYKPKVKPKKKIALVGKGVTYDTGGLSIKPTDGMLDMKVDMAGAGLVIGVIKAAALSKLPVELIGVIPAVENAVAGNSYKPGDVVHTSSGKSIEVKDTDAEGRIILADALEYASKQKPDQIIDFATLTGACVVALGLYAAGIFTKNDGLAERLSKSGYNTYERVWRLPFWDEYNKLIESNIADVSNLGDRWGGAITAGKFLEHFVDKDIPWVHMDIAGPSIKHKLNNYTEKYETGFGVRLMFDYLSNL